MNNNLYGSDLGQFDLLATTTETKTHHAKKQHHCDWCWEWIDTGDIYKRYRYYNNKGAANTVRMHPECYDAMEETKQGVLLEGHWMPGTNPRGCNCGYDISCERCPAIRVRLGAC